MTSLLWVQNWYLAQCDGDWEHSYGIQIETLDNPGWSVRINLEETNLEERDFADVQVSRDSLNWFKCWAGAAIMFGNSDSQKVFQAACGPLNLEEVLDIFKNWAEGQ